MATVAKLWVPDRRDMIWINFNPQVGIEMKDEHPMMVLSGKAFNARTGIVIGLPMTHAASNETNPFAIRFEGTRGEICYVLAHQPKSFAWRSRGARPHPWGKSQRRCFKPLAVGLMGSSSVTCAVFGDSPHPRRVNRLHNFQADTFIRRLPPFGLILIIFSAIE